MKTEIKSELNHLFASPVESEETKELFAFSQKQSTQLLQTLDKAMTEVPDRLQVITKEYENRFKELQDVVSNLAKVPDNDLIRPMYEKLEELNAELNELNVKKNDYIEQLNNISNRKTELQRNIDQLYKKLEVNEKTDGKLTAVSKVEKVLISYYNELASLKISHLEEEFSKIFKALHRKDDMISNITIDPITFEVCLFDVNNNKINKKSLSSGELELYAMSMLWALAKTSGQELPFIIDTPLARLDSHHRDNLVELFFPHAARQMMIFSTNTEIDKKYFDNLSPFISKAYNLEYVDHSKSTIVKEGYFWN